MGDVVVVEEVDEGLGAEEAEVEALAEVVSNVEREKQRNRTLHVVTRTIYSLPICFRGLNSG